MPPRSRRGGQARSWGAADQYGVTLGETVTLGRNDRRPPGLTAARARAAHPRPPARGSCREDFLQCELRPVRAADGDIER